VCHFLESSPAYQPRPDSQKVARPQRSGRMAFLRRPIHPRRLGVAVHRRIAAGMLLAAVVCSLLAKRIEVAKLYHFDRAHGRLFRRAGA
jgi:hypothetical protein